VFTVERRKAMRIATVDLPALRDLQSRGTTARVMRNTEIKGASHWSVRVRGQVIVVGDKMRAVALYDQALALGAAPDLLKSGRIKNRDSTQ
jgi:hypothetical protein